MRLSVPQALLCAVLLAFAWILPSTSNRLFASPDETAVAVSLQAIRATGSAAVQEPLAQLFPWLHPRSYVANGAAILPVGFLGWPWLLAQFNRFLPVIVLPWLASLLAISGALPWYGLLRRRFGPWAAWWGTALAWAFPPVLLYTNRALFSHIPQMSFALWAVWSLVVAEEKQFLGWRKQIVQLIAGGLFGLALGFRPIEAVWLVPVALVLVHRFRQLAWREWVSVGVGVVFGLLPLFIVQAQTYGEWFQVGYWIQANTDPSALYQPVVTQGTVAHPWYLAFAPYGLHPKNIWWNVRSFFFGLLWPWLLVGGAALGYGFWHAKTVAQEKMNRVRQNFLQRRTLVTGIILMFVAGWLLLIYGSGLYLDHVQAGAVTLGNSFLRYTLPIGFAVAWVMASAAGTLKPTQQTSRRIFMGIGMVLLLTSGYVAFFHDDENLLMTRRELGRYTAIREAAIRVFQPGDVVLSDRSDKIFFPGLRAVSPMPSPDQLAAFTERTSATSTSLGLFARPLSLSDRDAWRRMGYDVHELQTFGRERLYRLTPFLR